LAREDVVGDRAKRKDIRARGALVAGGRGLGREVHLCEIDEVVLDMPRASRRCRVSGSAFPAARDLPVHHLQVGAVALGVAHEDTLRREAAVVKPLAVRVGHGFAELTD